MSTTEQLTAALQGRYALERRIGEGGMATVYLARDLKHDRRVALKVLKPELGAVLGVERFLSEIRVTANLQHPNLLPLFDSGEAGGLLFYVMPFVEGESLRVRLEREQQLPIDEAVRIATAIASALAYAHERGVIHRDLKPENILLQSGQPVVADFGIALAVSNAGGARVTQTGLSLGTPQYMSPEQATGDRAIDARSDIYSLAAMTYEMIAGEPPHTGPNAQAIMAKLLTADPAPLSSVRRSAPVHVELAIAKALAKVPADRFSSASDFAAALDGSKAVVMTATTRGFPGARPRAGISVRERIAWLVALMGVASVGWISTRPVNEEPVRRFSIIAPDSFEVIGSPVRTMYSLALSPDGKQLAFVGTRRMRATIFVRRIDATEALPVAGTEGGGRPVFSPDGRTLLFLSERSELLSIPLSGGVARKLADTASSMAWADDGTIYFTDRTSALRAVQPEGGSPRVVASLDSGVRGRLAAVEVLPGSRVAYVALRTVGSGSAPSIAVPGGATIATVGGSTIGIVNLRSGRIEDTRFLAATARYVPPGYMLFNNASGELAAVRVGKDARPIASTEMTVASDVTTIDNSFDNTVLDFASSQDGTILYRPALGEQRPPTSIVLVERNGTRRVIRNDGKRYDHPIVSPDGRHAIIRVGAKTFDSGDLWVLALDDGAFTPLTRGNNSFRPTWSRDGKRIFYVTGTPQTSALHAVAWDGSGRDTLLLQRESLAEFEEGPAGRWSILRTYGLRDILLVPADSISSATPRPLVSGPANETDPKISPDGRLLAYTSDQSGQREVYVTPLPGPGPRVPVSLNGGRYPQWAPGGTRLYYQAESAVMAATIVEQPALSVSRREVILSDALAGTIESSYAVTPNGGLLLTPGASAPRSQTMLRVITNWRSLYSQRVR